MADVFWTAAIFVAAAGALHIAPEALGRRWRAPDSRDPRWAWVVFHALKGIKIAAVVAAIVLTLFWLVSLFAR